MSKASDFRKAIEKIISSTDDLLEAQKIALINELVALRADLEIILTRSDMSILNLDITLQDLENALTNRFATISTLAASSKARAWGTALADFDNVMNIFEINWLSAPAFTDSSLISPLLTTSRITGLGAEAIADIEALVVNGLMLEKTPWEVLNEITQITGIRDAAGFREVGTSGISYKAERILRTETMTALNAATYEKMSESKKTFTDLYKVWISTGDFRTRESHLVAHGQIVDVEEPFIIGGEFAMYPLDPALPLRERANCRCRSIPFRDAWGELSEFLGESLTSVEAEMERRQNQESKRIILYL